MPYQPGKRLPGERASRLGHLEVLQSDLVRQLCESFENANEYVENVKSSWQVVDLESQPLSIVFGVDGSLQIIQGETQPYKQLAFVKTALLRLDEFALNRIDKNSPHPFALRDVMSEAAIYHATVFPLRHVTIGDGHLYDAVRQIIFDSMNDASLNGEPLQTLKWIAYEKWDDREKHLPPFECPHCEFQGATLPYDAERGSCPNCGEELLITDMLGFHLDMSLDAISDSVATAYMNIHETMLLFTGIRYFWETNRRQLANCLFVKDGPLSIRAQYSKLVAPIRRFFAFALSQGVAVHILGQEKTGRFCDHLEIIGRNAPEGTIFIPDDHYIKTDIQHRPDRGAPYGKDTNYGAKVFVKLNNYHRMVISVPTSASTTLSCMVVGATRRVAPTENTYQSHLVGVLGSLLSSQHHK